MQIQYNGIEPIELPGKIVLAPGVLNFSEPVYTQMKEDPLYQQLLIDGVVQEVAPIKKAKGE